jgi:hypothetical protein
MKSPNMDLSTILREIEAKGAKVLDDSNDEAARKALIESARSLVTLLESPFEVVAKMNWVEVWFAKMHELRVS